MLPVKTRVREAWGAAPVAATAAYWALSYIAGTIEGRSLPFGGDPGAAFGTFFLYLIFGLPVAYAATGALAYPTFLILQRRGRVTKPAVLLAAVLIGIAVVTTPVAFRAAQQGFELQRFLIGVTFGALTGVVGGLVFIRLFPFDQTPA